MTVDVASLAIRVASDQVETADKRLRNLKTSGAGAEKATDGLSGAFTKLLGPLAATVSVLGTLKKIVDVQRQFDILNSGLITATGSSEKAAVAFQALTDFAQKTPYDLNQAVKGFTELVNLGLTPSERALTSYGNTASAMGKDLNQMIEAVADAATGEFERLKEFGIKAHAQGNQISFVFQGVTTTVANNAASIEKYLTDLGENQFAGAMARRMDTLDGAISNLGDTWDQLFRTISQDGVGGIIEDAVKLATSALQELTDMLASGQIDGYLASLSVQFGNWSKDSTEAIRILREYFSDSGKQMGEDGQSTVGFIIDAFKNLPSNIRALIQIVTVEVAAQFDKMSADAGYLKDSFKAIFTDDTLEASEKRYIARLKGIDQAHDDAIATALAERDASVKASDAQVEAANKARKAYDEANKARAEANKGKDRLAEFKVGGTSAPGAGAASKANAGAAKARATAFAQLKESLQTEEESVQASYEKRLKIIKDNTKAGSDAQRDLMARLDKDRAADLKKIQVDRDSDLEQLKASLQTREEAIQSSYDKQLKIIQANKGLTAAEYEDLDVKLADARDKALAEVEKSQQQEKDGLYASLQTQHEALVQAYERKKQAILDSTAVTETERQDLLTRLQKQFQDEQDQMQSDHIKTQLKQGEDLFGGLAGLAKSYAGEQSKAYKTLFAISKAFSVAQSVMAIATGIAKAQELGFPANIAAMAQVAASGAAALSQVKGSQFSGAYDKGGNIPAGKVGIVGEYGPEIVRGPASVTGRKATERAMSEAGSGQQAQQAMQPVQLRVINSFDTHEVVGGYLGSDQGEQAVLNVVRKNPEMIQQLSRG